jgi:hypothetical protein
MNSDKNSIICLLTGTLMLMVGLFILNPDGFFDFMKYINVDNISVVLRLSLGTGIIISGVGLMLMSITYQNQG